MIKYKGIPASSITYRKAVNHVSKKALFIGAHNDDCECAAGATAALLADKGYETVFLNPAVRHRTPLSGQTFWEALRQQDEAARLLGARKIVMGPHGEPPYQYDDVIYTNDRENMLAIRRVLQEEKPDLIFIHWPKDNHVDHAAVSRCSMDAICLAPCGGWSPREVYAFEAGPYQTMVYFQPDLYITADSVMDRVKESLLAFDQPGAGGKWLWKEKEVSAAFRGHVAGVRYAEAFKILKFPVGDQGSELWLRKDLEEYFSWAGFNAYPWGRKYFL